MTLTLRWTFPTGIITTAHPGTFIIIVIIFIIIATTHPVTQTAMVPSAHSGGIGTRPVVGRSWDYRRLWNYRIFLDFWPFQTSADVTVHDIIGTFWRGGVNTGSNIIRGKLGTRPTTTLGTKQWRVHAPPCLPPQREAYGQCCQRHRGPRLKTLKS